MRWLGLFFLILFSSFRSFAQPDHEAHWKLSSSKSVMEGLTLSPALKIEPSKIIMTGSYDKKGWTLYLYEGPGKVLKLKDHNFEIGIPFDPMLSESSKDIYFFAQDRAGNRTHTDLVVLIKKNPARPTLEVREKNEATQISAKNEVKVEGISLGLGMSYLSYTEEALGIQINSGSLTLMGSYVRDFSGFDLGLEVFSDLATISLSGDQKAQTFGAGIFVGKSLIQTRLSMKVLVGLDFRDMTTSGLFGYSPLLNPRLGVWFGYALDRAQSLYLAADISPLGLGEINNLSTVLKFGYRWSEFFFQCSMMNTSFEPTASEALNAFSFSSTVFSLGYGPMN